MQRYFVPRDNFSDTEVVLTGDDARHLSTVMRSRVGERIICSNGLDFEAVAEIVEIEKGSVRAVIVERLLKEAEPAIEIWIAQSLPKGDKMEMVIQRGTEIGAARFVPFVSDRTIVQYDRKKEEKRLERWRRIAKEAAEQAHRNRVPEIGEPLDWSGVLALAGEMDATFICYEHEQGGMLKPKLREALAGVDSHAHVPVGGMSGVEPGGKLGDVLDSTPTGPRKVLLVVGPEGGFTEQEIERARNAGLMPVSLGRRILRTETAAMVALTCILYEIGEMGG